MAIFKAPVAVLDAAGQSMGEGHTYVHLPRGLDTVQRATGTVSLKRWSPGASVPAHLALDDGRRIVISVTAEKLSDCSRNQILRFEAAWPPEG